MLKIGTMLLSVGEVRNKKIKKS